jgi:hypothetical protein
VTQLLFNPPLHSGPSLYVCNNAINHVQNVPIQLLLKDRDYIRVCGCPMVFRPGIAEPSHRSCRRSVFRRERRRQASETRNPTSPVLRFDPTSHSQETPK